MKVLLEVFHGFDGIKHLVLVMPLIMLYQMFLWQLQWTCEMIQEGKFFLFINFLKKIFLFVFSIHPRTKPDVGYRLSRSGLAVAYGQNVEYLGPIVSNVVVASDSSTIDVTYSNVTAIEFRNSGGFEVY